MANKEKNFVSAVLYVHNDEDRIEEFIKTVAKVITENFEHSEIICVNDCSTDNSVDIIKKFSKDATGTSISILNMSYFHGLETSMNAGVDLSIGDFVFEFDKAIPDFEPSEIMKVYERSLEGYDIVSATSDESQSSLSSLFYFIFDKFTDLKYDMKTESFRVLSRRVINRISGMNKTVPYRKAVYASCGLKTDSIKYKRIKKFKDNDKAESKYKKGLAVDTLILFTDLGYSFAKTMTFIMILAAVFMAVYSVVIYLTGNPVAGWTTTILFLSFSFFGLFGILTVIIKYLQIIVSLVFKRKRYTFESIEKLTK